MNDTEEQNRSGQNLQHLTINPAMNHKKTINPSVASIQSIIESRKQQHQTPVVKPAAPSVVTYETQPARFATSSSQSGHSVYPEATRGFGVHKEMPVTPSPSTEPSAVDANIAQRIMAIKIVASVLMLVIGVGFYSWYILAHAGFTSWIDLVELVAMFGLAIGIYRLIEIARLVYVVIASLVLILMFIGILYVYHKTHTLALYTGHDPARLLYDAIVFMTSIFPIVFFTRPSIRTLFG